MLKTKLIISAILLSFMFACEKEDMALVEPVYNYDPMNPSLPQYSEWGYNTFGAYYNRIPFVSDKRYVYVKFIVTDNKTRFTLEGDLQDPKGYKRMKLRFEIEGYLPNDYDELVELNDTVLDLKHPSNKLTLLLDDTDQNMEILNGQIEFKKAQFLYVDKEPIQVILSGVFAFRALVDEEPVALKSGRFDLGVGYDSFFRY